MLTLVTPNGRGVPLTLLSRAETTRVWWAPSEGEHSVGPTRKNRVRPKVNYFKYLRYERQAATEDCIGSTATLGTLLAYRLRDAKVRPSALNGLRSAAQRRGVGLMIAILTYRTVDSAVQ